MKSNFKLYEITNNYNSLLDKCLSGEEDIKLIDELIDDFDNKSLNVARYILNLEAESEAIKKAADEMLKRSKSLSNAANSLRNYLKDNIEKTGLIDPIKCAHFVIKLKKNPPSLVVDNEEIIPDAYKIKTEVISIDKNAIKRDILEGFLVEGARVETKKTLVIK